MDKASRIYVAGHRGLVGSAICRKLIDEGCNNLITRTHDELDLCDQVTVNQFFKEERPEYVFLAAAVVGGIHVNNSQPVRFLRDNLLIQTNVIESAYKYGVKKLAFLGSTCIYPRDCSQPIKEEYLLTGALEETNQWYAIAKISGIKLSQAYQKEYGFNAISLMPTNLYGPHDNFDLQNSHVLPALIRKFHEGKEKNAKTVEVWGSGKPYREFLYIDDMADACCFLMQNYDDESIINIGTGEDISIKELAELIRDVVGFQGDISFDSSKPDGTPKKLTDVTKLNNLGWKSQTSLKEGLEKTYQWYVNNKYN
ncbi:MAG: GDP-L-fucose synthase family protein [Gammaproteobacteria bacterium]|jgi:GDP-L-fucose synthase